MLRPATDTTPQPARVAAGVVLVLDAELHAVQGDPSGVPGFTREELLRRLAPHVRAALAGERRSVDVASPGRRHTYWVRAVPAEGAPEHVVVLLEDVTRRKTTERALARLAGELRERNDDLERANRELHEFASVVAHDLASPLYTITAYLELVRRRLQPGLDPEVAGFLAEAVGGAEKMRDLVDGLLHYARAGTVGAFERISAHAVVDDVLAELRAGIVELGAEVHVGDLPELVADPRQLRSVLLNLVSNALKYRRDDRAPVIEISARRHAETWLFCVSDNGLGIAPEDADRIFDRLERAHPGAAPGAGLGLAICKTAVARHGGRIWAEPRPGGGTRFCFTIAHALGTEHL